MSYPLKKVEYEEKDLSKEWIRIDPIDPDDEKEYSIIIPQHDSEPHSTHVVDWGAGVVKAVVSGIDCPCNPQVDFIERVIIHNAFDGRE